jgi:tetratricopeptide (TPR) repeat protein
MLRTVMILAWGGLLFYVARAAFNLFQLVRASVHDPSQIADPTKIAGALLLPPPFDSATTPLWVFIAFGVGFCVVLYGSIWASFDAERERKVLYTREIADALSRNLPGSVRERLATAMRELGATAEPEAQGPPFDDVLLPPPDDFIGRGEDLDWLLSRLRTGKPGTVTAITGLAGIGKTSLVAVAVRRVRAEDVFPDGIAVVLGNGLTDPAELLRRVLARFDPQRRQPDALDLPGLAEAARRTLSGKDALVVIDNVEPALAVGAVVGPLRAAGARVLLDSNHSLPHTAVPVDATRTLHLPSPDEAAELFVHAYGAPSLTNLSVNQRTAVYRILAALGRHTLAVKLAGAYAADMQRDLATFARELENPARAIALPEGGTPQAVSLIFRESIAALPADTRRLFTALAAFPTEEFSRNAALAVAEAAGVRGGEGSIYLLVTRALVYARTSDRMPEGSDRERLRLHPLLRAFALGEFAQWSAKEREALARAVARYYAEYVSRTQDGVRGPDEANITGALEWAHEHGQGELVAALCAGMQIFWRDRWRIPASLRYLPWGIAGAEAAARKSRSRADRLRAANLSLAYAQTLRRTGKIEEAEKLLPPNLAVRRELGDRAGEALVLAQLGYIALHRRELDAADRSFSDALEGFRETGNRQGEGEVLSYLGQIAQYRGDLDEAVRLYNEAHAVLQSLADRHSEGRVLTRLGKIARARGDLDEAERYYERALAAEREAGDAQDEGVTLMALGDVLLARDQVEAAERHYRDGLEQLREIQDVYHYAAAALSFGGFLIEQGDKREEGCKLVSEAVRLYGEMGLKLAERAARDRAKQLGCSV